MKSPKFSSVEEYLASLDPTKERTLRSVIDLILTQFPELESKISWNVPTIHRNGKYVVGVCAYKHHLTFSPWSSRVIEDFKVRLGKFVLWKNCFEIPVDWEIDRELVFASVFMSSLDLAYYSFVAKAPNDKGCIAA